MTDRCIHGIERTDCSLCLGYKEKKEAIWTRYNNIKALKRKKLKEYQKKSIEFADRYNLPIEDWEIEKFLKETSKDKDYDVLFILAGDFQRTFNAMLWWWHIAYKAAAVGKHHAKAIIERIKTHKDRRILTSF